MGLERVHHLRRQLSVLLGVTLATLVSLTAGASVSAAQTPLSIAISGNQFVNGSGQPIRLLGVNHPSSEYACVDGTALHDHLLSLLPGGLISTTGGGAGTAGGSTTQTSTTTTAGGTSGGGGSQPPVTLKFLKGIVQSGGRGVGFNLRSAQTCTGTLTGQTAQKYVAASAKSKRHPVSLGSVHFALKAGKAKTVVLTLSKAARKLLAAKPMLKVQITITLVSAAHKTTVVHRTVTLKAPAKR